MVRNETYRSMIKVLGDQGALDYPMEDGVKIIFETHLPRSLPQVRQSLSPGPTVVRSDSTKEIDAFAEDQGFTKADLHRRIWRVACTDQGLSKADLTVVKADFYDGGRFVYGRFGPTCR